MKSKENVRIPLRNMGFLLYHMAKSDIYDPDLVLGMEKELSTMQTSKMTSRHAMGGLYGYYRLN
jgi:hypothetical protein